MTGGNAYPLFLYAAILCGLAFLALLSGKPLGKPGRRLTAGLLAVLLGFLLSRLFYFFARAGYLLPMYGWGFLFGFRLEGLAFGGAALGVLLAGWLSARALRVPVDTALDALLPAALLALAIARAGEYSVHIGEGPYVEAAMLQFFPLAIVNEWGEWYFAVFMLEALCALLVLAWTLARRDVPAGLLWRNALLYLLLTQVFCESLRAESLRWGFVRVHQLFSVLTAFALLAGDLRRGGGKALPRVLSFLLGVGLLIGIEFALDKWMDAPDWALYLVMLAALLGMGWAARPRKAPVQKARPAG